MKWLRVILLLSALVAALSFAVLGVANSKNPALAPSEFPKPSEDFNEHINQVRNYLLATQMPQRGSSAVDVNLPFEIAANNDALYRGKFLLIHGLNDSPYIWRDMAQRLALRGFDVRAILLPGHGNTPEAQLNISYKDWLKAARQHKNLYQESDKDFFIGGFSMGGVIATLLASENSDVDGLLLFSPAYKSQMHHMLRWAKAYSVFKPWVFGGMIIEDNPAKYNSIPINGAAQYYKTTQALRRHWPRKPLNIPVLMVASENDSVVDISAMQKRFNAGFTGDKRLVLYTESPLLSEEQTAAGSVEYRSSFYPEQRLLNQSHQSVLIAEDNPLYGQAGDVLVCNGNDWPVFSACLYYQGDHWYGAQHTPSPDEVPVARTTYNPDLDYVMQRFDELFLK